MLPRMILEVDLRLILVGVLDLPADDISAFDSKLGCQAWMPRTQEFLPSRRSRLIRELEA